VLACLALVALLVSACTSGAAAAGQDTGIQALNAQRAANGLPAGVPEDPIASSGCAAHDSYMHQNNFFGHGEDPSKPGYSTLGDIFKQPYGEVLAQGDGNGFDAWLSSGTGPWESAPIHLFLFLDPTVSAVGGDESFGFDCMRMAYGRTQQGFYSYPGPDRVDVRPAEHAAESPYVPQEKVGIPASQTTGPNILLWGGCTLQSASIASGSADSVDSRLIGHAQLPNFFHDGGDLIPVKPLGYFRRYTVTADWACGTQTFAFTTGGRANQVSLRVDDGDTRPGQLVLRVQSDAPSGLATVSGPHGQIAVALAERGGELDSKPLKLAPGHYEACATTGSQASGYETATDCQKFDHPGLASSFVSVSTFAQHASTVSLTVKASGPVLGRTLWVAGILMQGCGQPACGGSSKHYDRAVNLKASQTFSFAAPRHGAELDAHFTTMNFSAAGISYRGLDIFRSAVAH
jgi:hypothetical protein